MGVEYQTPAYATKPLRTPLSAEIVQVWLTRVCSRFSAGHQEVSKCQTFFAYYLSATWWQTLPPSPTRSI